MMGLWGKMCGIIFLPFVLASIYNGDCNSQLPVDDSERSVNLMDLNGTIWTPIRHYRRSTPRFNPFDSSPSLILDCVEFHFKFVDGYTHLLILPTNCTKDSSDYIEETCWMEDFVLEAYKDRSYILHILSIPVSPTNCAKPHTQFYLMTPDIEQVLVFWSCFDFGNGSIAEGIWILSRKGIEMDFQTYRQASEMINSLVPVKKWILPRHTLELCTCQTRFATYPCTTDEQCLAGDTSTSTLGASVVEGVVSSPSFLMWFLIGVVTFAVATVAFIRLSGISECLCNENYNAF